MEEKVVRVQHTLGFYPRGISAVAPGTEGATTTTTTTSSSSSSSSRAGRRRRERGGEWQGLGVFCTIHGGFCLKR
eukprot:scaffold1982_cov93-Amphora_coffeaeformis.AAC.29